jgi:hypothetical protein
MFFLQGMLLLLLLLLQVLLLLLLLLLQVLLLLRILLPRADPAPASSLSLSSARSSFSCF